MNEVAFYFLVRILFAVLARYLILLLKFFIFQGREGKSNLFQDLKLKR